MVSDDLSNTSQVVLELNMAHAELLVRPYHSFGFFLAVPI